MNQENTLTSNNSRSENMQFERIEEQLREESPTKSEKNKLEIEFSEQTKNLRNNLTDSDNL